MKNELEMLNEYLIYAANKKVGIRRKIVELKKFISSMENNVKQKYNKNGTRRSNQKNPQ